MASTKPNIPSPEEPECGVACITCDRREDPHCLLKWFCNVFVAYAYEGCEMWPTIIGLLLCLFTGPGGIIFIIWLSFFWQPKLMGKDYPMPGGKMGVGAPILAASAGGQQYAQGP